MRLNYEAVRDILIYVADNFGYTNLQDVVPNQHESVTPYLAIEGVLTSINPHYKREELAYAIEQLLREGFFRTAIPIQYDKQNNIIYAPIIDLTMKGHELLTSLENQQIWDSVQELSKEYGGLPLETIATVCKKLALLAITQPDALLNAKQAITSLFGLI